jgi:REP element-mobilizing transposase RayT
MAHTHTVLLYHIVFSTKGRRRLLTSPVLDRLIEFAGGIVRQRGGRLFAMNGAPEHVHLLAGLAPKAALADQVRDIKSISSGWLRDNFPHMDTFAWQEGYSAFTLSGSSRGPVEKYIAGQEEHHRQKTFEEELIEMLERAGVEYDKRFVFD